MAAAVETMAYVGAVPWHGLGNKVDQELTIEGWQEAAGLNWSVSKRPVQYNVTRDGQLNPQTMTFKDRFVLARDSDDRPFAVVAGRYKPVQPKEVLEFFRDLTSRHGMQIETAGSLKDGGRIWALAKTGDAHKVLGNDEIKGYLNVCTSYDLTLSTMAYFTSVRVVCNNTLQASFGDMQNMIKIPHVREFKIEDIHDQMGLGKEHWDAFTQACETLARIKIDSEKAREVLNLAYQIPEDPEKAMLDSDRLHVQNVFDIFTGRLHPGADVTQDSMWSLLNAQTFYIDHKKRARNQGNRLDSAWYGDGFAVKQRTFDELMKLAA